MFSCSICDKTFTRISSLQRHAKSHDVSKKISCSICSEIFTRKDNLIRHSKDKHRSNNVVRQQSTITKQEIQDFFKPAEHIYDYNVQSRNGHKRPYHTENSNEA
ncbi:transcriptional regulator of yeast form adherence 4-like, partial [Myzus persicae]|uniref:transcriptional regulator of yeast form adherence 4-like n=1 Tax=Myzus persicae TaxID=13164 RepID=UPI000B939B0E